MLHIIYKINLLGAIFGMCYSIQTFLHLLTCNDNVCSILLNKGKQ